MYTPECQSIWVVNKDTKKYICSFASVLVEDTRLDIMKHFVATYKKCILDENETNDVLARIFDKHPELKVQINSEHLEQLQRLYVQAAYEAILSDSDDDECDGEATVHNGNGLMPVVGSQPGEAAVHNGNGLMLEPLSDVEIREMCEVILNGP